MSVYSVLQTSVAIFSMLLGVSSFMSTEVNASPIKSDQRLEKMSRVTRRADKKNVKYVITQGTQKGKNLFHSFSHFSVNPGQTASFQDIDPTVKNVFARVTGPSKSVVNGTIEMLDTSRLNSRANLFLLNPRGIEFQEKAAFQELQGSFIATTSHGISFSDGRLFSTQVHAEDNQLSSREPKLILSGMNPGPINLTKFNGNSFQPSMGNTFLLIGGRINISQTILSATDTRIEIAAVDSNQSVPLISQPNLKLKRLLGKTLAPIHLRNNSNITINGVSGSNKSQAAGIYLTGSTVTLQNNSSLIIQLNDGAQESWPIDIHANQLSILDTSFIFSNNFSHLSGSPIRINADNLHVDCALVTSNCAIVLSNSGGVGRAGDIAINVNELTLRNGGQIASLAQNGSGLPGNIEVNGDRIQIKGGFILDEGGFILDDDWRASGIVIENRNKLRSNQDIIPKIDVRAKQLTLQDGGIISSATLFNANRAGDINVDVKSLDIVGNALNPDGSIVPGTNNLQNLPISSGIFSSIDPNASGQGGRLAIQAKRLTIRDGGKIQSATFGAGQAGNILIESDLISVSGQDIEGTFPSTIFAGSGGIPEFDSRPSNVPAGNPDATGRGNNIQIQTKELFVSDQGTIAVGSLNPNLDEAKGAGNINIAAESVVLNNGGRLLSDTASGNGGSIRLTGYQATDRMENLFLLNSSQISTTAGQENRGGDGGDVSINANNILANSDSRLNAQGSDITANAFNGDGGNIRITADLLLGLQPRVAETGNQTNDIDASSELGTSGTINVSANLVDPTQALVDLPVNTIIPKVARRCDRQIASAPSSLIDSGKGGLVKTPTAPHFMSQTWEDLRLVDSGFGRSRLAPRPIRTNPLQSRLFVEAQGFMRSQSGQLMLVPNTPTVSPGLQMATHPCLRAHS